MEPFFFFDSSSSSSPHNPSDVEALRRLSDSLLLLRISPSDSFSDLTIAVRSSDPPRDLAVHRCILSARSPFFRRLLPGTTERLDLGEILPCFDVIFDALVLVVGYLYSGKVGPLPRGVCECADEDCRHVACRPAVEFMAHVLFAASGFEISELVSLFQVGFLGKSLDYHLANLDNWVAPTKIAMANKTLIPSLTAAKFPDLEVNLPDGGSLKLPIIPGKYATDTSERIIPSVSLFCLSFRANSQAMTSSWSAPFLGAFSPSGEVQVYE